MSSNKCVRLSVTFISLIKRSKHNDNNMESTDTHTHTRNLLFQTICVDVRLDIESTNISGGFVVDWRYLDEVPIP